MKVFKKLIIPLVILILLVAGLIVYAVISSKPETDLPKSADIVKLIDGKKAVKLTVDSIADNRKIVISKLSKNSEDYYEIEGIKLSEGQTISQKRAGGYFEALSTFTSNSFIVSGADLAEYGLDKPLYTITVENDDGSKLTILLGNESLDGKSVYVAMKDSKDVYSVEIGKKTEASRDPSSFISNEVWNIQFKDVSDLVFKRKSKNIELAVKLGFNPGTKQPDYVITSPYYVKAGKPFVELIKKVFDFEVTQYVTLTDDEKAKLGLNDPEYVFTLNFKHENARTICLSAESDGYYYGYIGEDKSKVFSISKDQMKELELPVKSLINKSVISFDPTEVKSITVTNGSNDPFRVEINVGYGDTLSSDESSITLNKAFAKIITPEGRNFGSILFESVVNVDIEDIDQTVKPAFNSEFNVRIVTKEYEAYNYDFVKRTDQTYYVFLNEEYTGFYVKSDELFKKESKDSYSYGIIGAYDLLCQAIKDYADGKYQIKTNNKPAETDNMSETVDPDVSINGEDDAGLNTDDETEITDQVNPDEYDETEETEKTEDTESYA